MAGEPGIHNPVTASRTNVVGAEENPDINRLRPDNSIGMRGHSTREHRETLRRLGRGLREAGLREV
ncbi:MAG TPA: hypothetical protein VIH37_02565, partial [Candidatus Limnocylindrales bacterium]